MEQLGSPLDGFSCNLLFEFVCFWRNSPHWARASSFTRFLDHTQRRITVGRTPLDETSARRRNLYLTTHNTHSRQISMPPVGFEPTISAGERPQTNALDRAATGTGNLIFEYVSEICRDNSSFIEIWQEYRTLHEDVCKFMSTAGRGALSVATQRCCRPLYG